MHWFTFLKFDKILNSKTYLAPTVLYKELWTCISSSFQIQHNSRSLKLFVPPISPSFLLSSSEGSRGKELQEFHNSKEGCVGMWPWNSGPGTDDIFLSFWSPLWCSAVTAGCKSSCKSRLVIVGSVERNNRYSRRDDALRGAEEEPLPDIWKPKWRGGRHWRAIDILVAGNTFQMTP